MNPRLRLNPPQGPDDDGQEQPAPSPEIAYHRAQVEVLKAQVELSRLIGFQPYEEPSRAERDLSPIGRSHR